MIPHKKDITIKRGDTKEIFFRVRERIWDGTEWVPGDYRDLTGYSVLSQIRETADSVSPLLTFTASLGDQVIYPGSVLLRLTPIETGSVSVESAVWDCQLTDTVGDVFTYIEGSVTITKDVSRVG